MAKITIDIEDEALLLRLDRLERRMNALDDLDERVTQTENDDAVRDDSIKFCKDVVGSHEAQILALEARIRKHEAVPTH